jgi:hypothetical protein
MSDFDDQPLVHAPVPLMQVEPPRARADSRLYMAVAAGALILGAVGAWWWSARRENPPARAAVTATEGVVSPPAVSRTLPPLEQMDTFLRALFGALSSHPQLARWLATDDLIRQMADSIDKISRGESPAKTVSVLKPQDVFEIKGARGQMVIDPRSYRRYEPLASAVASLNANGLAQAYRTIQPRLDEAYRALGRSENTVDEAINVALTVLLTTPDVQDPIRVVPGKGATYAFADPNLESLAPMQKHLIRMGPQNAAIIRARLRELADALAASPKPVTH